MTDYAEVVALAARELDAVRSERWDELPALDLERRRAVIALGENPPDAARPYLERALELEREIDAGLAAARAFTLRKLVGMDRGSTAVRGYAGAGHRPEARGLSTRV
ncbi:MAG TPA: hypothetical protein VNS09_08570 [Solirubrobacter sp.]|nr:hypothetical protein [Solirubrobacter sp.]